MSNIRTSVHYDVIVIGAGHAGCEAALAAARAGCAAAILTPNLDRVGYMPCNPSVGGPGKSHIVAEVDALGGEIARAADRTALQVRQLNTSKGPAVQAIRIQSDKQLYALAMKEALETQPNLDLLQDEVVGLIFEPGTDGRPEVAGATTRIVGRMTAHAVIVTAGTFLRGSMIAGNARHAGGRAGDRADAELAGSLMDLGFRLRRLKTGTPPRVDARSVEFSETEPQAGSDSPLWLSRDGANGDLDLLVLPTIRSLPHLAPDAGWRPQLRCYRVGTNEATHDLIRANLDRAPMYNGNIEGIGPRYCPSIEDKVARFADKETHPIFLEPEGWRTTELYVQGMSTSLPVDVQDAALRSIPALRRARITRYGYAVEYDAVDPTELTLSLESRRVGGLFLAGQVNGTSGYEEAAGQGILAGINAAALVAGRPPLILRRDQAYIGVMIDDLTSKPFDEPYRMLTSRAEYRLLLRPDTADARLAPLAYDRSLIPSSRYREVVAESDAADALLTNLAGYRFGANARHEQALSAAGLSPVKTAMTAADLLRRPGATARVIGNVLAQLGDHRFTGYHDRVLQHVENSVKYGKFIEKEAQEAAKHHELEERLLPSEIDFGAVPGLRVEARQKLIRHRPVTFGQAKRLPGVTPADISALLVHATRLQAVAR